MAVLTPINNARVPEGTEKGGTLVSHPLAGYRLKPETLAAHTHHSHPRKRTWDRPNVQLEEGLFAPLVPVPPVPRATLNDALISDWMRKVQNKMTVFREQYPVFEKEVVQALEKVYPVKHLSLASSVNNQ